QRLGGGPQPSLETAQVGNNSSLWAQALGRKRGVCSFKGLARQERGGLSASLPFKPLRIRRRTQTVRGLSAPAVEEPPGDGIFNGVKLVVETPEETLFSQLGANVTLPCRYRYEPALLSPRPVRIKWWKLSEDGAPEQDVLVAIGLRHRSFGDYRGRVRLPQGGEREASLQIWDLRLEDSGRYRCEVIDGLEDESGLVELELRGVVFPYQHPRGRYQLNFHEAQRACEEQDAVVASFEQLFRAWEEGLDWCNAGWLQDASVQYPVTLARQRCGGLGLAPGVRSYGPRHRRLHRYDVFCFSAALKGECRGWAGTGRGGGGGGGGGGRIWGPLGPVCPLTWSPCRLWSHDWLRFERFVAVSHGSLV
uniref:Hyaluronan and proteoglycan link protein 3 n=1 Tax=Suricata suricatta TaxID=37032 RepID=A0A673TNK5_SURSU